MTAVNVSSKEAMKIARAGLGAMIPVKHSRAGSRPKPDCIGKSENRIN
jgi:hypothetical protein